MNKLFLIDAYALIFRSYYAFISRPMRNNEGLNTSAIFGFIKFLREIMKREQPEYLGVAFDPKGGNFRHQLYPLYKANRSETPEDIISSVPYIKAILEAMQIPIIEIPGYEADDVIGTLSCKAAEQGFEVFMVTPDKDYGQLVQPNVYIYKQKKGGSEGVEIVGLEQIKEHYGVSDPKLIIDILALWGDASDNIPGVPGIGEKGAIKLVNNIGSVEDILSNIDQLSGKQKQNIIDTSQQLKLSKQLATIETAVPLEFKIEEYKVENPQCDKLREIFTELNFSMFLREMDSGDKSFSTIKSQGQVAPVTNNSEQTSTKNSVVQGGHDLFSVMESEIKSADTDAEGQSLGDLFSNSSVQSIETTDHKYMLIDSEAELKELVATLSALDKFCFDTETTGFDTLNDKIVGISISFKEFEAYYIPINEQNKATFCDILKPVFEDEHITKIGQNIKFDLMVLANAGIQVRGFKIDTMILHYLLDPESRHNMNFLSKTYLNYQPIEIESLIGRGAKQLTMDLVNVSKVCDYAAEDADVTFRLYLVLWPLLVENQMEELYRNIEEPLIDVLAKIETNGVKIDVNILKTYGEQLTTTLNELEIGIREIAEDPTLNINSAKQLGDVLFVKLKIDDKPKRTKSKQFKTDEEYLQQLSSRHPIVNMILEYRGIKKLLSTYIDALPQLVNKRTGRIHTSYNQAVTATGRLSSTNPNLQNIPIRDERGREIRKAFVPSDEKHTLLSVDYSQIELRVMAHLSEDPALIDAFKNDEDIHSATAAKIFGVPISEVNSEQRRKAKTANFGIIYGISVFGLAQRLNIGRAEAKEIIDGYFSSYQGVKTYMDTIIEKAREQGYVSTIFGRRRFLKDIRSGNAIVRGLAERNAINAPIQGSAADIMKLAMIGVQRAIEKGGFESKVILQVHDELVIDMLLSEQEQVVKLVVDQMENAAQLAVKLTADYGTGNNWVEAH